MYAGREYSIEDCSELFSVFTGNQDMPVPGHANNYNCCIIHDWKGYVKFLGLRVPVLVEEYRLLPRLVFPLLSRADQAVWLMPVHLEQCHQ